MIKKQIHSAFLILLFLLITGCQSKSSIDEMDYHIYLKKVWIVDSETLDHCASFVITKIEDDWIEGLVTAKRSHSIPDTYAVSNGFSYNHTSIFTGTVKNGKAVCEFQDYEGNKGMLIIKFVDKETVEVQFQISDSKKKVSAKEVEKQNSYQCHLLKLSSEQERYDEAKEIICPIQLEGWGTVHFVAEVDVEGKPFPIAYLVDEEDNVLYTFNIYDFGYEVTGLEVKDMDGNGRNDIVLKGEFYPAVGTEAVYFQMENGWFLTLGYSGRPYEDRGEVIYQQTYEIELYEGKNINLVYEEHDDSNPTSDKTISLYTVDENGDVLFHFPVAFSSEFGVVDPIVIEDFNGDGLNDIQITFYCEERDVTRKIIYYQMANGWFLYQ